MECARATSLVCISVNSSKVFILECVVYIRLLLVDPGVGCPVGRVRGDSRIVCPIYA